MEVKITEENLEAKLSESCNLLDAQDFAKLGPLLRRLLEYCEANCESGHLEKVVSKCHELRERAKAMILDRLETVTVFEQFQQLLQSLSEIVDNKRQLWNILHSEMNASLKVTLRQSQLIAAAFFSPVMLFEYGFDAFRESNLTSFSNVTNEEALIDIFYAIAGFVSACNLPVTYQTSLSKYVETIHQLLSMFTKLPDFDAHRFVWLVEAVHNHLHLTPATLRNICESVLNEYIHAENDLTPVSRLHKLCVASTSPFLQHLPIIRQLVNSLFQQVIEDQRIVLRKYIFGSFACMDWSDPPAGTISEPLKCWRLYLINLVTRMQNKPELPPLLLADFLDDSLIMFVGYYGDLQVSYDASVNLRLEIFTVVELTAQYYATEMEDSTLKRIWYLLFIAAISGARESDLSEITPAKPPDPYSPFLGLERTGTDFSDYRLALSVLSGKLESESNMFTSMIAYIRKNY